MFFLYSSMSYFRLYYFLVISWLTISSTQSKIIFDFSPEQEESSAPSSSSYCPQEQLLRSICNKKYEPVVCGSAQCLYSNLCIAKAASSEFNEATCCPQNTNIFCSEVYDPVECTKTNHDGNTDAAGTSTTTRKCIYRNTCHATTSVSNKEWKCSKIVPPQDQQNIENEEDGNIGNTIDCPLIDHEIKELCKTAKVKKIFCGVGKCKVDNMCTAKQLGWKKRNCTKFNGCPLARSRLCKSDTRPKQPVSCGEKECFYFSMCLAQSAGFREIDCDILTKSA
mmetsp:Transcript_12377/g.23195  ORF Transcript_12377/g.23195 Transcript_12377/m.23195 type:complete len:280 (+) Transcript_12377:149-988(+)